ncbi:MAG: hypothetical protein JO061_24640, partial [Acidobacteriaceae bacterium]|nr:hypothetical protein [Acidobacteriaceae bacterium]
MLFIHMHRVIAVLLLLAPAVAGQSGSASDYTIFYTGRTLGYYRIPDEQTATMQACDETVAQPEQVRAFFAEMAPRHNSDLLLGLGDNFGPDLFARTILIGPNDHTPKDQL